MKNRYIVLALLVGIAATSIVQAMTEKKGRRGRLSKQSAQSVKIPANMAGAQKLLDFKIMASQHKTAWLSFLQKRHSQKFDLMKQHQQEFFKHVQHWIRDWAKITDCSPESKNTLFKEHLNMAIEMHKKCLQDWKNFCDKEREIAEGLYNKQMTDLEKYEQAGIGR